MDRAQASPLADCPDPPVRGEPVKALAVSPSQDRSFAAFADGKVDRPGRAGAKRGRSQACCLAEDAQRSVAPIEAQVLDVGGARLADP
jgi:hypothetical protein